MTTDVLIRGVAALGVARLRELAANVGLEASSGDARALAEQVIGSLERPEELEHRGLTDADVEAIGEALGIGMRAAWKPRMSAEEFARLPFYQKPSYDQYVWTALLATDGSSASSTRAPKAKPKPKAASGKRKAAPGSKTAAKPKAAAKPKTAAKPRPAVTAKPTVTAKPKAKPGAAAAAKPKAAPKPNRAPKAKRSATRAARSVKSKRSR